MAQTAFGPGPFILTVNGGSSSLKVALFRDENPPVSMVRCLFSRIGFPDSLMTVVSGTTKKPESRTLAVPDHAAGMDLLMHWLEQAVGLGNIRAVGHRVVHGGVTYSRPERVTPDMLAELRRISPYDPEHLPSEISLIEAVGRRCPGLFQAACFDTAFHHDLPRVAALLPIPRRYDAQGLRRYGFHGLSCAFLMRELTRVGKTGEADGRIILAHLGNGASMTAVRRGRSIETTMGFTPTSGLPMSRRSGDLDPGIIAYLARTEGMDVERFHRMVNAESGLLGVSELSPDMRDLLAQEARDPRAAEAVALFCYHARKAVGALAATLGGLDTLVFSGGIGEHAAPVRARICESMEFLGITIDPRRNQAGEPVLSRQDGQVTVRLIPTDEETEIARSVHELLGME
ncbi:Acetate kinase [Nitrospira japonica]|uniref:Acetate kinase n=1 Tax=Nitrospira japonica TaxID=1325564 RepID=A0A1W1I2N9_9BACT|nr:acetate/propionate family kinase [Nitrospira japonica]SLM47270.1 Acetate kinase [Nitrospira japonica]